MIHESEYEDLYPEFFVKSLAIFMDWYKNFFVRVGRSCVSFKDFEFWDDVLSYITLSSFFTHYIKRVFLEVGIYKQYAVYYCYPIVFINDNRNLVASKFKNQRGYFMITLVAVFFQSLPSDDRTSSPVVAVNFSSVVQFSNPYCFFIQVWVFGT